MVWGSLAALSQKRIKRLMAYSGIANVGWCTRMQCGNDARMASISATWAYVADVIPRYRSNLLRNVERTVRPRPLLE